MGLSRLDPVWFEAAFVEEPGHALRSSAGQEIGGAGKVAVGRKRRGAPDGSRDHVPGRSSGRSGGPAGEII
jgi:hypothetical protein